MKISVTQKNLIRRYLIWGYKSTKESFERIERKMTQLMVDEHLLKTLQRFEKKEGKNQKDYQKFIEEFVKYMAHKKQDERTQKFSDGNDKVLNGEYLYLRNRLKAIEGAIKYFLGALELKKIESLYEKEFVERILKSREH